MMQIDRSKTNKVFRDDLLNSFSGQYMIYIKIKTASDVFNLCDIIVVWSIQVYHDIFVLIRNL